MRRLPPSPSGGEDFPRPGAGLGVGETGLPSCAEQEPRGQKRLRIVRQFMGSKPIERVLSERIQVKRIHAVLPAAPIEIEIVREIITSSCIHPGNAAVLTNFSTPSTFDNTVRNYILEKCIGA